MYIQVLLMMPLGLWPRKNSKKNQETTDALKNNMDLYPLLG